MSEILHNNEGKAESPLFYPLQRGLLIASASLIIYLLVAVLTTPSLLSLDAIRVAFLVNWWVISGLTVGVGAQTFLITYFKRVCNVKMRRAVAGGTGSLSSFSSFLSFFSLVPVGCCGSWLYIISFLPSVIGTGASSYLLRYSNSLTVAGLSLMGLSIIYTYASLRKRARSDLKRAQVH